MAGINDIAKAAGLKQEQVEEVFTQVFNTVSRGEKVRINGFGTFSPGVFKGRTLTTPAVNGGEPMKIPTMNMLKFKQSNQVKLRLNKELSPAASAAKKTAKKTGKKAAKKTGKKAPKKG